MKPFTCRIFRGHQNDLNLKASTHVLQSQIKQAISPCASLSSSRDMTHPGSLFAFKTFCTFSISSGQVFKFELGMTVTLLFLHMNRRDLVQAQSYLPVHIINCLHLANTDRNLQPFRHSQ
ncbi:Dnaj-like protein subfamily b member 4 [Plakobranchus ocellatus]|uniref:Dnaj-like protein subfamily b member 4 n=1 Tax=Plakobranchus ocellatus TaxID=259542 RepID=A0AAV3Y411_9GAST|nr:Dnaj-like protein subfamily b member 4 [Plakobranchus ocellatus]